MEEPPRLVALMGQKSGSPGQGAAVCDHPRTMGGRVTVKKEPKHAGGEKAIGGDDDHDNNQPEYKRMGGEVGRSIRDNSFTVRIRYRPPACSHRAGALGSRCDGGGEGRRRTRMRMRRVVVVVVVVVAAATVVMVVVEVNGLAGPMVLCTLPFLLLPRWGREMERA